LGDQVIHQGAFQDGGVKPGEDAPAVDQRVGEPLGQLAKRPQGKAFERAKRIGVEVFPKQPGGDRAGDDWGGGFEAFDEDSLLVL
jgi:hypothetical protein